MRAEPYEASAMTSPEVAHYLRLGWALVPVPAGLKHPILKNWHLRQFAGTDLDPKGNVALRLGRCSRNLVDMDHDCQEAIELTDLYLPPTGAEFGRKSKPRSHRLYISVGATFEVFHDPLTDRKNTLLELRADGPDGGPMSPWPLHRLQMVSVANGAGTQ
jgi:hypothetical protein